MFRLLAVGILCAVLLLSQNSIQEYQTYLATHPDDFVAHSNLGVLLAHAGRYDEAAAEYRQALKLNPANASIRLNLGLAFYKSGRIPEAAEAFEAARKLAPDNMQLTLLLADCRLRMGDNSGVVTLLEPVEKNNPDNLAIAYLLGTALIRDRRIEEGQKRIDRILRNGDSAEAHLLLGNQMLAAGAYPDAVKELQHAIQLNPSLPGVESLYGQALLYTGDPDAAAEAFRNELANDPNDFDANLHLGEILIARERWTEAEPLVHRALRVRPQSVPAMLALADVEIGQSQFKDAQSELMLAGKLAPQSADVHDRLFRVDTALHLRAEAARQERLVSRLRAQMGDREQRPAPGDAAPEFAATEPVSKQRVDLYHLRKSGPAVLVFGSYTCPNFRAASGALNRLYAEYKGRILFYLIYIREAHSDTNWQSTRNVRDGISLAPAMNMTERAAHEKLCVRKLHIEFPALLDDDAGTAATAYAAWPSSAFVINANGRIAFRTGLTELEFKPAELEAAIRGAAAGAH